MKQKRVWLYSCDFCGKKGRSAGHMRKHERRCTKNPQRECGVCKMMGWTQRPIEELLAVLPTPTEIEIFEGVQAIDERPILEAMPKLKALTDGCPACIMAALRQKGIPLPLVSDVFDYTKEINAVWDEFSATQQEKDHREEFYVSRYE